VLDELPSLEFAATAVAGVLVLRALRLGGGAPMAVRRSRVESARARDLIGLAILVGAIVYAVRMGRASTWFLVAIGVAIAAQVLGFYLRPRAEPGPASARPPSLHDDPELEIDEDEDVYACPQCGHGTLLELTDPSRLMGGLQALTPVSAFVCPSCGTLSGQVEDPARIPVGREHGTTLRQSPSTEDQEALQEPAEHDG
jgi:predicted RNA-binding Zn-ribbon protein involved in translation (DUF1610 family)